MCLRDSFKPDPDTVSVCWFDLAEQPRALGTALGWRLPQCYSTTVYLSRSVHESNRMILPLKSCKYCCVGKLRASSCPGVLLSQTLVLQCAWQRAVGSLIPSDISARQTQQLIQHCCLWERQIGKSVLSRFSIVTESAGLSM